MAEISRDPSGCLFLAERERDGRRVAVKSLARGLSANADALLSSPLDHTLEVIEVVYAAGGAAAIVLDPPRGATLEGILSKRGTIAPNLAVSIAAKVLSIIKPLHDRNEALGNLNPGVIFISRRSDGRLRIKIAYLGIVGGGARLNAGDYLSPELMIEGGPPTPQADLWAAAAILYEMLIGRPPFHGKTSEEISRRIRVEEVSLPKEFVDEHPAFATVIRRALEKNPRLRFPSGDAMSAAFKDPEGVTRQARDPFRAPARARRDDGTARSVLISVDVNDDASAAEAAPADGDRLSSRPTLERIDRDDDRPSGRPTLEVIYSDDELTAEDLDLTADDVVESASDGRQRQSGIITIPAPPDEALLIESERTDPDITVPRMELGLIEQSSRYRRPPVGRKRRLLWIFLVSLFLIAGAGIAASIILLGGGRSFEGTGRTDAPAVREPPSPPMSPSPSPRAAESSAPSPEGTTAPAASGTNTSDGARVAEDHRDDVAPRRKPEEPSRSDRARERHAETDREASPPAQPQVPTDDLSSNPFKLKANPFATGE